MSNQSLFEKLELNDEKNLLIQGLPSSIEKQFAKLSYAKNVTPLLKNKKVDFALIFAINQNQLTNILKDVFQALRNDSKLWVAYPKITSKIVSDLNRECSWKCLAQQSYEGDTTVVLDHVWSAIKFKKATSCEASDLIKELEAQSEEVIDAKPKKIDNFDKNLVVPPAELEKIFTKHKKAKEIFSSLSPSHQKEYVSWIEGAKKVETRQRRSEVVAEKLLAGKRKPTER